MEQREPVTLKSDKTDAMEERKEKRRQKGKLKEITVIQLGRKVTENENIQ
jgi:hypothetical protein